MPPKIIINCFQLLRGVAFELPEWTRQVHLQKYIFHTLNCFTFDTSGNFFVAECWVLEREMDTILQTLHRAVVSFHIFTQIHIIIQGKSWLHNSAHHKCAGDGRNASNP